MTVLFEWLNDCGQMMTNKVVLRRKCFQRWWFIQRCRPPRVHEDTTSSTQAALCLAALCCYIVTHLESWEITYDKTNYIWNEITVSQTWGLHSSVWKEVCTWKSLFHRLYLHWNYRITRELVMFFSSLRRFLMACWKIKHFLKEQLNIFLEIQVFTVFLRGT